MIQEEIENPNKPITTKETELVISNIPTKKNLGPDGFPGEFYQTFKKIIIDFSQALPKKKKREIRKHNS